MCGYEVETGTETRMRAHRYAWCLPVAHALRCVTRCSPGIRGRYLCGRAFGQPFLWLCLLVGCLQYNDTCNQVVPGYRKEAKDRLICIVTVHNTCFINPLLSCCSFPLSRHRLFYYLMVTIFKKINFLKLMYPMHSLALYFLSHLVVWLLLLDAHYVNIQIALESLLLVFSFFPVSTSRGRG